MFYLFNHRVSESLETFLILSGLFAYVAYVIVRLLIWFVRAQRTKDDRLKVQEMNLLKEIV